MEPPRIPGRFRIGLEAPLVLEPNQPAARGASNAIDLNPDLLDLDIAFENEAFALENNVALIGELSSLLTS